MSNFESIQRYATPIPLALRWSDQDLNVHVNNARILTLMEEARIRVTQKWANTMPDVSGPKRLVRAVNANFDQEVLYGPDTVVWVWVSRIGNSSFVLSHLLAQDGVACVYSEATMVVVDGTTGKTIPHDETHRAALELQLGPAYTR